MSVTWGEGAARNVCRWRVGVVFGALAALGACSGAEPSFEGRDGGLTTASVTGRHGPVAAGPSSLRRGGSNGELDVARSVTCRGREATLVGTAGADRLRASRDPDVIAALGGNDVIENVGAKDWVCAGGGDDVVETQDDWAIRVVDLGPGDDRVHLVTATDVYGGAGDDRIVVEAGVGAISGGPGDDYLRAVSPRMPHGYPDNTPCLSYAPARHGVHVDLRHEKAHGEGRDLVAGFRCVRGSGFDDVLVGTEAREGLDGGPGDDLVHAGAGADSVAGGIGSDHLHLGPGDDRANGEDGRDRIYGDGGADYLEGWSHRDHLEGGAGNDQVYGALFCAIGGNSYDTAGLWDGAPDELFGGTGDDYLVGDRGNDRIDGGPGHDWAQPGFRDGRVDWVERVESFIEGCLDDDVMRALFGPAR